MPRLTLPRSHRLAHDLEYKAVYDAKVRKAAGPLAISLMPNGRPHHRLGLSVGRSVGTAVSRTRCKRLVREAFRLLQHDLPMHPVQAAGQPQQLHETSKQSQGFDIVVQVRSADALTLEQVQTSLQELVARGAREWAKRSEPRK
jgi:ribonuclease P protein component